MFSQEVNLIKTSMKESNFRSQKASNIQQCKNATLSVALFWEI